MIRLNVNQLKYLYEVRGMTYVELAKIDGRNSVTLFEILKHYSVKSRSVARRDQLGNKNFSWKGNFAKIDALHARINVLKGKPKECAVCGKKALHATYDWANLTGHYEDLNDYKRMCRSCHKKYDHRRLRLTGSMTSALSTPIS